MKKINKNIWKSACLLGVLAVTATSCNDWLTVYPQNRVVEENFWEDKNDLEGVRYGAYKQMSGTVSNLAVWGDLRSDTYNLDRERSNQGNRELYDEIMKGMPDSSMSVFDWGGVYKTINYCNKVLQHGEEILEKDKQFTPAEWIQMRAEMTALRALNYFYLIRSFKDVPYTTKVINSDKETMTLGLTNQLQVLDSIILDCEKVEGQARNRFTNTSDSKGLITNTAIYAMLADMYLWRASLHAGRGITNDTVATDTGLVAHSVKEDYQLAADYADKSLAALANQTQEEQGSGYNVDIPETENFGLTNCNMLENDFDGVYQSTTPKLEAYNEIFVDGNSVESIFELQFRQNEQANGIVNSLYGNNSNTHLAVSEEAVGKAYGAWGGESSKYDSRMWYSAQNLITTDGSNASNTATNYYCIKHMDCIPEFDGSQTNRELKAMVVKSNSYRNWIVYRMTDVMLIKAEALACIGGAANEKVAKQICNAIHRRSYCNYNEAEAISPDPSSGTIGNAYQLSNVEQMVMNERQIELLGEGKRWFDLVRYAERHSDSKKEAADERESTDERFIGNGQTGVVKMVETYLKNAYSNYYTTLKNRFKNRYGLYCPIYYMEVKASDGKILQNPVWNKSKYDQ